MKIAIHVVREIMAEETQNLANELKEKAEKRNKSEVDTLIEDPILTGKFLQMNRLTLRMLERSRD